jgi:competence ComEA-like helix-hairpin-helix protein
VLREQREARRTGFAMSQSMFMARTNLTSTSRMLITALTISLQLLVGCVRREFNPKSLAHANAPASSQQNSPSRININTASADELEQLPGIGKGLAQRIIEHRERFGPFRRPEHLIVVRGISDKRFRTLQDVITVE